MKQILKFPNAIYRLVKPGRTRNRMLPNEVLFHVPLNHNKIQIKNYLEEIYGVKVARVDTSILYGSHKKIRVGRRVMPYFKKQQDIKKAYVTLKEGSFIFPTIVK
mmetsp:Transcript_12257/g.18287  ORF Transcript_12257/g.18287 Transcript_12257/m.18287 type:complete len:105 (+) Transcript_12257:123-437(+)